MSAESWRPVVGYEGIYEVSDLGIIKSLDREDAAGRKRKGGLLKPAVNNGYQFVNLCKDRIPHVIRVHAVVAHAFLGAKPDGLVTNHLDGNKQNNRADNLAYVTPMENVHHAIRIGLKGGISPEQVRSIREIFAANPRASVKRIAAEYGTTIQTIRNVRRAKTYTLIPNADGTSAEPVDLPKRLHDVYVLLTLGYKMASISRILGVNPSTTYRALNRAGIHFSRGGTLADVSLSISKTHKKNT